MSIWDDDPKNVAGSWEGRYENEAFWKQLTMPVFFSSSKKWTLINNRLQALCKIKPELKATEKQWSLRHLDLSSYHPYKPVMDIDLRLANREIVELELQQRIEQQATRIEELHKLVSPWTGSFNSDLITLDTIELWFSAYLHLFNRKEFLSHVKKNPSSTANPYYHKAPVVWYSIALDISLYMSAMLQNACSSAYWGISNKSTDWGEYYNRPVLFFAPNLDAYSDFEVHIWSFMTLLQGDYVLQKNYWLSREYKKTLTRCNRVLKKHKT